VNLLREYIREVILEWQKASTSLLSLDKPGMEKYDRDAVTQFLKKLQLLEGSRIVPTSMSMSEWESYKKKNKTTAKAYDKKSKTKWKITHGPGHKDAGKTIKGNTGLTYKKAKSIQNAFGGW
jgi:hypothetical protein